ncbi:MAG TPA: flagellar basal body rod protein FlgB [Bacteroidetes bacterium]|nr:flagellar basal body rod protein FlgB [Bacteroidota bacterium]
MFLQRIFQKAGVSLLNRSLDAAALRHEAIASNIANVETPGYQRREVKFEEKLRESLDTRKISGLRTDARHLPIGRERAMDVQPELVVDRSSENNSGVNNVDIDQEMANLAKNQIYFSASATLVARKFRGLKEAIRGRL